MHSILWFVDSGASSHFSVVREDFITLSSSDSGIVSGISVRLRRHGTCKLTLVDLACIKCTVTVNGALYVPDVALRSNVNYLRLLCVPLATNRGCRFEFTKSRDRLWTPEGSVFEMVEPKGIVWSPTVKHYVVTVSTTLMSKHANYDIIHRRCCHVSDKTIRKMLTLRIQGIPINFTYGSRALCISCVVAKSTVANTNRDSTRTDDPDTCFHTLAIDIWGPVNTPSIGNFSYVVGAVCYKSAFIMAELIKTKSYSVIVFRSLRCKIRIFGYGVHIIRIDNDSVFLGADF